MLGSRRAGFKRLSSTLFSFWRNFESQLAYKQDSKYSLGAFKSDEERKITIKDLECDNYHITWTKAEFIKLLSQEIGRISLKSAGQPLGSLHRNNKNDFARLAGAVEKLLLLQGSDESAVTANKFRDIDPDRVITASKLNSGSNDNENSTLLISKELDFLKHMSPYLKQAGYLEIPSEDIKQLLSTYHRYGNIELEVDFDHFDFLRVWVFGRSKYGPGYRTSPFKEFTTKEWWKYNQDSYKPGPELCHRRVVVAAKSKDACGMILKCFKDVPVGHFEALIPQAKIHIPWKQKWFWNIFLFSSGSAFFFNVGLWLQSEHKLGSLLVTAVVVSFVMYRTRVVYRNIRNRYHILWKQMLYYKSTSNNSALALEILNRARGQNFKKTVLAYVAALRACRNCREHTATKEAIIAQCNACLAEMAKEYPDRQVKGIDFDVGFRHLVNIGILSQTNDGKAFEVEGVGASLQKVEAALISHCVDICTLSNS